MKVSALLNHMNDSGTKPRVTVRKNEKERLIEAICHCTANCEEAWAEPIADGLLDNGVVFPPVKVGQTVYYVVGSSIMTYRIDSIEILLDRFVLHLRNWAYDNEHNCACVMDDAIGKVVFFALEEAEAEVKKRYGGIFGA